jgi:YebC/PmpR family DNA-binding regulatory protein
LISVAAREGGGDPDTNPKLKDAIQKAKDANMPNDNIERAIKKGTGEIEGIAYESMVYEGYGPGGVAIMLDITTDNRNRTASEIRHIFDKYNGNLGESGCVAWMFKKKGQIMMEKRDDVDEDEVMLVALEAGAEDVIVEDETIQVITESKNLEEVKKEIENNGFKISSAEITMIPSNTVKLEGRAAELVMKLIEKLEDHDDVQEVYANFDIPEEIMEEYKKQE